MTDSEIVKALTVCHKGNGESECEKCPYVVIRGCMDVLGEDALGLIHRQQIEIEKLKAADVQPVKHGEWFYGEFDIPHCSECGNEIMPHLVSNYCPNCGAKMDGEESG